MKKHSGHTSYYVNVSQTFGIAVLGALGMRYVNTLREANGMQKRNIRETVRKDAEYVRSVFFSRKNHIF